MDYIVIFQLVIEMTVLIYHSDGAIGDNFTVYGGLGWNKNTTMFVVDEQVSWYTAVKSCEYSFDAKFKYKGKAVINAVENVAKSNNLNDRLIWTGLFKSGHDNRLYKAYNCVPVSSESETYDLIGNSWKRPGENECVMVNTSSPSSHLVFNDCEEMHPYLCFLDRDKIALTTVYYNVSVDVKSHNLSFSGRENLNTSEDCKHDCHNSAMTCVGSLFDHMANKCHFYVHALNGDFHTKYTFLVQTSTSETTFYYKSWQRLYFDIRQPNTNNTGYSPDEFKCFDDVTTESSLSTTKTMHCYCALTACSINSTDSQSIQEKLVKIQNAMFIDKSQLSSAIRKRISASDPRPSSKYIGLCGGIVIGIILLLIVLADIPLIYKFFRGRCEYSRRRI